jgi:hypothetical protein
MELLLLRIRPVIGETVFGNEPLPFFAKVIERKLKLVGRDVIELRREH